MGDIKLLAFDLDGTTITQHKYLSRENREALVRAQERGVLLVPATGRMKDFVPEEILSLPGVRYVITANGAAVYDMVEDKPVYQRLIPNETAQRVQALLDGWDTYIEYYSEGRAITKKGYPELAKTHFALPPSKWHFVEDKDYWLIDDFGAMLRETGLRPEKINLPYVAPEEAHQKLWEELEALGGLRLTSSIPDNIEINAGDAEKGSALLALARLLGFSREQVMAVGDNGNDVTMLQAAGVSVAVADGSPEARAAAGYVTGPHDQNGLAQAVEKFLLGEGNA